MNEPLCRCGHLFLVHVIGSGKGRPRTWCTHRDQTGPCSCVRYGAAPWHAVPYFGGPR